MKAITFLLLFLSISWSFASEKDHVATITCNFEDSYGRDPVGKNIEDHEGYWSIVFDRCSDGKNRYTVIFKQHKYFNLDFLYDKKGNAGFFKITCLGSGVRGTYHGFSSAIGAAFGSLNVGRYISVQGELAACQVIGMSYIDEQPTGGLEIVSPQQMIIK